MTTPTGVLFYDPQAKPLDVTGNFQAGAQLFFYSTGTLNETNVYANGTLTTPLSQPILADSAGRFVPIYMDPAVIYHVQLYNAAGTLLEDVDPFVPTPVPTAITTLETNVTAIQSQLATLQSTVTGLQTTAAWSALTGIPAPITALAASTPPDTQQTFWRDDGTWAAPSITGNSTVLAVGSDISGIGNTFTTILGPFPVTAGKSYKFSARVYGVSASSGQTLSTVMTPNSSNLTGLGPDIGFNLNGDSGAYQQGWDSTSKGNCCTPGLTSQSIYANANNAFDFNGRFSVPAGVTTVNFQVKVATGSLTAKAGSVGTLVQIN